MLADKCVTVEGPRDINGNRRSIVLTVRELRGEPIKVSAEEYRRIVVACGLRESLNAEDAEALDMAI